MSSRMQRASVPEPISRYLERLHRQRGVHIHLCADMVGVDRSSDGLISRFSDDRVIASDIGVVAAGLVPNDELARRAGLTIHDGILTDGAGRTANSQIFAIGDVARLYHDRLHRRVRLES